MTLDEYESQLAKAGSIQRAAGWSDESIQSYAIEHQLMTGGNYECIALVGAGLAQDNTRHGVFK